MLILRLALKRCVTCFLFPSVLHQFFLHVRTKKDQRLRCSALCTLTSSFLLRVVWGAQHKVCLSKTTVYTTREIFLVKFHRMSHFILANHSYLFINTLFSIK